MREQKSVYLLMFFYYQCLFRACDLIGWRSSSCDVINPTQAHILIGVGGERITLMIVSNKKQKKWHFVPLWSHHVTRSQFCVICPHHVTTWIFINKWNCALWCHLVLLNISYMCLNDPADRINFNFSKKFDKILFTSCDWAVNVTL